MSEVNTIGASSTLTEKKLEASIAAQTDVSPQTSVEAQKKPLDENKDSFVSAEELKNKVSTFKTADANPKAISETKQATIVDSTWKEVAKASNELIPEQTEITIGKQKVTLGSQETIATTGSSSSKRDIKINSLTTEKEFKELQTGISEETRNIARTQDSTGKAIPAVQARIDKMRKEVRENTVPEAEQNQERDVETSSNTSVQKLDTSRAALNERILKLEKATKDDSETFNAAQKAKIQKEITALQTERDRIDKETKIVQLSNGAMIKYKGSDLVEIGSGDAQVYEQKLSANYKGNVRKVKDDGNLGTDTEAEATRADAYKEFKARYKAQTGKELELKENQRLVMYKRADDVIYQIIESSLDDKNNRTTVISNEIKEAKAKKNDTDKEVEGLSGIKDQGNMEVRKFSFNEVASAEQIKAVQAEVTRTEATQDFALKNIKISKGQQKGSGRQSFIAYEINPTDEQLKLLRSASMRRAFTENKDEPYAISKHDLATINKELKQPMYEPVITHLNNGGKLSDILLNSAITRGQLIDTKYTPEINNLRYRALITYLTKSENNDGRALIRALQENGEILAPWVNLINDGINTQ